MVTLPLITGMADRTNRHGPIMSLSLLVVVVVLAVISYVKTFILILGLVILATVSFTLVLPLSNSAAMVMLGERRDLYSRVRLGGTIGFGIAATVVGALVEHYGLRLAFWIAAGLFFATFLTGQKLVHGDKDAALPSDRGRAMVLLRNPHFLLFLLVGFSGGVSFATLTTYMFLYMKDLGAGESLMGVALTMGTVAEVPVLFYVTHFIKRFSAYTLVVFSIAMTAVRFLLMAAAPGPEFVLIVQLLNGLNYPLLTVAGVTYADEQAPAGSRATAQGLFNVALGGIGSALGGFVGGLLFDGIGPRGMYVVFAVFIVLVLLFVTVVRRALPPEQEPASATPA